MSNNTSSSVYDFLLQQMAAESYFDTADRYATPEDTRYYLELGTNREGKEQYKNFAASPNIDGYPGLTRMTKAQATEFTEKFQIIHQWSDFPDGARPTKTNSSTVGGYLELNGQQILANTGLSATLIVKLDANQQPTNEYTLAIRSTEFRPFDKGGDGERDTTKADLAKHGVRSNIPASMI